MENAEEIQHHPGTATYLIIAAVLTVLTAIEVTVFYVQPLQAVIVPVLISLSAIKFALVVMFYMHLKFDRWMFSAVFLFQLLIAFTVIISLFILFSIFLGSV